MFGEFPLYRDGFNIVPLSVITIYISFFRHLIKSKEIIHLRR